MVITSDVGVANNVKLQDCCDMFLPLTSKWGFTHCYLSFINNIWEELLSISNLFLVDFDSKNEYYFLDQSLRGPTTLEKESSMTILNAFPSLCGA